MQATTERGFAYLLVAMAFSAFILCRFIDVPSQATIGFEDNSQQILTYGFPFMGSPLSSSSVDPVSEEDGMGLILGAVVRSFCVAIAPQQTYGAECRTPIQRGQPIWLLNCAMLC